MKIKLLLITVLCAFQGGLTIVAAQAPQPAKACTQNATKELNSFQKKVLAFALIYHKHCGMNTLWNELSKDVFQQICDDLKRSLCFRCDFHNFETLDINEYYDHMQTHRNGVRYNENMMSNMISLRMDCCFLAP